MYKSLINLKRFRFSKFENEKKKKTIESDEQKRGKKIVSI